MVTDDREPERDHVLAYAMRSQMFDPARSASFSSNAAMKSVEPPADLGVGDQQQKLGLDGGGGRNDVRRTVARISPTRPNGFR